MSEVKSRPPAPRGRNSARGGRGGFSNRGGRGGSRQLNGNKADVTESLPVEDEGEIGQLKSLYSSKLSTIKEMFPDWTDQDIVYALQETEGDLESTIERISEGNISQWGEVKKKNKDRSQPKPKDPAPTSTENTGGSTRGGRGRAGLEGSRGGRGRGSDRARGTIRGGRGAANGTRNAPAPKTNGLAGGDNSVVDSVGTDTAAGASDSPAVQTESTPLESSWENISADVAQASVTEPLKPSSKPDGTRSWASMFAKPAPAAPKAPRAPHSQDVPAGAPVAAPPNPLNEEIPGLPPPIAVSELPETPSTPPVSEIATTEQAATITPSKDDLTETNLEQVPDSSGPPMSATAASTVASTMDPRSAAANATPLHASQPQATSRLPLDGYATSAYKATGMPARSSSYQRKIIEQQEAVVMPGKHASDRAAVQFGSMGLNGLSEDVDVDSDREDAETRAQPPQHSPVPPRAALPPAPQQPTYPSQPQPQAQATETLPAPRQAPGLPPAQPSIAQQSNPSFSAEPGTSQLPAQAGQPYIQYTERFGNQPAQQESAAPASKPYEPFGQQLQQQHYDAYPSAANAHGHNHTQHPNQSLPVGLSSANADMSSYYTSDSQRNAYHNNYAGGTFGQQPQQAGQETGASQPRVGSAFGTSAPGQASQYATAHGQQAPQGRFGQSGDAQTSGHSTPNLSQSGQQPSAQPHQMLQQQQGHGQGSAQHGGYYGGYPYSSYYNQFQYGYGGGQGGYGGGPFGGAAGKQGMYGQPHQGYGMSPQTPYDQHSASPANVGAFGQQLSGAGRDSTATGGLGNYGRSGSAQPTDAAAQQYSNSTTGTQGAGPDVFGRSQSGYPGTTHGLGTAASQQTGNEDPLRTYGDSKTAGGPSPAVGQPSARPGSAANPASQSGLPAPQSERFSQQGYGGYPSHMSHQMHGQQGSQYGSGPGAAGGHQSGAQTHQTAGYGGYGAAGYGANNYYGNNNRGGWGANYGH